MAVMRTNCPECGAGLKSPTGFAVGQTICCPKCETYFVVEEPAEEEPKPAKAAPSKVGTKAVAGKKPMKAVASAADDEDGDDDDDKPKKKKKKKKRAAEDEDGEEWSYKNSWIRLVVLGVLLVIMVVLGYMLYKKWTPKDADNGSSGSNTGGSANAGGGGDRGGGAGGGPAPLPPITAPPAPGGGAGGGGNRPPGKKPNPPGGGGGKFNPPPGGGGGGLPFFEDPPPADVAGMTRKLAGAWEGDLPNGGGKFTVEYKADGTYTEAGGASGTWKVLGPIGSKGLRLQRTGGRTPIAVHFEGDELVHDGPDAGTAVILKKK